MPLDAAFDLVWTRDCVLYVPAGEQRSLSERLGSVLVPNGQLFVTDFCRGEAAPSPEFTRHISDCQGVVRGCASLVHGVTLIKLSQRQYGKTSRSPASVTATNAKHAMRAWACVKSRPSEAS